MKSYNTISLLLLSIVGLFAQAENRWQQHVDYEMEIDFNVENHQFVGYQTIVYTNNSPDQLDKVFYHLYLNAFQPNSAMDIKSRLIIDPDGRVRDRIHRLEKEEQGYQKIISLTQDGATTKYVVEGTILEVDLAKPIMPGAKTTLKMKFETQVPVQVRRTGRNNREGIDYSMSQWYPKLCEYDYQGWHANPYIGREFYGVWGDFDVKITIDENYILGGSGIIQNPNEVRSGYETVAAGKPKVNEGSKTWHFVAENVHDFVWAADRDYKVVSKKTDAGTLLYFLYQPGEKTDENWGKLPDIMFEAQNYMDQRFGEYPYPVYYFIQAGDGGMEYPMATLITGNRNLGSLVGVSIHEWMHSWYQMVLGTNESLYAWMDEGFTSFGTTETMNYLRSKDIFEQQNAQDNPFEGVFKGFYRHVNSGLEEPLSIHSDHFDTNRGYGVGAYTKGSIFLKQLEYILGEETFAKALVKYYNTWKFKHPNDNDFIRIMEKESGLELDWYREYMVNSTKSVDYAVYEVDATDDLTSVTLVRDGGMPMPLDVQVEYKDGTKEWVNIPLRIMRGEKKKDGDRSFTYAKDWSWVNPVYTLELGPDVQSIFIDPEHRMTDLNRENNYWELVEE